MPVTNSNIIRTSQGVSSILADTSDVRESSAILQQLRLLVARGSLARDAGQSTRPSSSRDVPRGNLIDYCPGLDVDDADGEDIAEDESHSSAIKTFLQPHACSFLAAGQEFHGRQKLCTSGREPREDWQVQVRIQCYQPENGYICGVMEALNVPSAKSPIITFWEGEIIDNRNHSFYTGKWRTDSRVDLDHWSKFNSFMSFRREVLQENGKCQQLSTSSHVFMRWKEQYFVNVGRNCGLTIEGFYYVCMERQTGNITGYYYDPKSTPFQELDLKCYSAGSHGHCFGSYQLR